MHKFIIIFVLSVITLFAEWDPNCIPQAEIQTLNTVDVKAIEEEVLSSVKNSWCSQEKARLIFELVLLTKPAICVEIGPFIGSSTIPMLAALQHLKQGHAFAIDAWSNEEATRNLPPNDPHTVWWSSVDMLSVKNQFMNMIRTWSFTPYCSVIQSPSSKASNQMDTIDFLHIDGNFSEKGALDDTLLYLPKVKSGGYILLSNILMVIDRQSTKKRALWPIFDSCEIISEIENTNAVLFRKK